MCLTSIPIPPSHPFPKQVISIVLSWAWVALLGGGRRGKKEGRIPPANLWLSQAEATHEEDGRKESKNSREQQRGRHRREERGRQKARRANGRAREGDLGCEDPEKAQ